MSKALIVAQREYVKVVRKPSFWISTLIFPVLMGVLIFISGYSSASVDNKVEEDVKQLKQVLVLDESGLLNTATLTSPFQLTLDKASAVEAVRSKQADAFLYYPSDIAISHKLEVYGQDRGLIANGIYSDLAQTLLKQNLLLSMGDTDKIQLFNASLESSATVYEDGNVVKQDFNSLIVPIVSVMIYFTLIMFASSYLLMSVSEEKENRVIETVLSIIKPKALILGKIIGQIAIVVTQLIILLALIAAVMVITKTQLPIDLSTVQVTAGQLFWGLFYLICGFIIMANVMVGVGAAMPTYKEAQSFSSIFIILSILPIYFAAIIIAEPSGTVAMLSSYFPLTAPMILLFRNALGELSTTELIFSAALLLVYVYLTLILAFKLFEFGSLEYSKKISFRRFLSSLLSR
jgi:ABC-2 type transport system permease protein